MQSNGTIAAVDLVFVDWFGKTNEDLMGQPLSVLVMEPGPLRVVEEHICNCDRTGTCMQLEGGHYTCAKTSMAGLSTFLC